MSTASPDGSDREYPGPFVTPEMLKAINMLVDPNVSRDDKEAILAQSGFIEWAAYHESTSEQRRKYEQTDDLISLNGDGGQDLIEKILQASRKSKTSMFFVSEGRFIAYVKLLRRRGRDNDNAIQPASGLVEDITGESAALNSFDDAAGDHCVQDGELAPKKRRTAAPLTRIPDNAARRAEQIMSCLARIRESLNIDDMSQATEQALKSEMVNASIETLAKNCRNDLAFLKEAAREGFRKAMAAALKKLVDGDEPGPRLKEWLRWCEKNACNYAYAEDQTPRAMLDEAMKHVDRLFASHPVKFARLLETFASRWIDLQRGSADARDGLKRFLHGSRSYQILDRDYDLFDARFADRFLDSIAHWFTLDDDPGGRIELLARRIPAHFTTKEKKKPGNSVWPCNFTHTKCWDQTLNVLGAAIDEVDEFFLAGSAQEKLSAFGNYLALNRGKFEQDLKMFHSLYRYFANAYTVNVSEHFSAALGYDLPCRWEAMEIFLWQGVNKTGDLQRTKKNLMPKGLKERILDEALGGAASRDKVDGPLTRLRRAWREWLAWHREINRDPRNADGQAAETAVIVSSAATSDMALSSAAHDRGMQIESRRIDLVADQIVCTTKQYQGPGTIVVRVTARESEIRTLIAAVRQRLSDEGYRASTVRNLFGIVPEIGGSIEARRANAARNPRAKVRNRKPEILIADCRFDPLGSYLEQTAALCRRAKETVNLANQIRIVFAAPEDLSFSSSQDIPVTELHIVGDFTHNHASHIDADGLTAKTKGNDTLGKVLRIVTAFDVWRTRVPVSLLERVFVDAKALWNTIEQAKRYGIIVVEHDDPEEQYVSTVDSANSRQCWNQLAGDFTLADVFKEVVTGSDPAVRSHRLTILALLTRIASRGAFLGQYNLGTAELRQWLEANRSSIRPLLLESEKSFVCERSEAAAWMRLFIDVFQFDFALEIAKQLEATKTKSSPSYTRRFLCSQHELLFRWAAADRENRETIHGWLKNKEGIIDIDSDNISKRIKRAHYHLAIGEQPLAAESIDNAFRLLLNRTEVIQSVVLRWRALACKTNLYLEWKEKSFSEVDRLFCEMQELLDRPETPVYLKASFAKDIMHLRAKRCYYGGDTNKAQELIAEILQQNPRDFVALSFRGLIERHDGRLVEAEDSFVQVLAIYPDNHYGLLGLGETYAVKGRKFLSDRDMPAARGWLNKAVECFRRILNIDASHVPALVALARVEMNLAEMQEDMRPSDSEPAGTARMRLERAIALEPSNQRALLGLAIWLLRYEDGQSYSRFRATHKNQIDSSHPLWLLHDYQRLSESEKFQNTKSPAELASLERTRRELLRKIELILSTEGAGPQFKIPAHELMKLADFLKIN